MSTKLEGKGIQKDLKKLNKSIKKSFNVVKRGAVQTVNTTAKTFNNLANKTKDTILSVPEKIEKTTDALLHGRNDYPPYVRDAIKKYGDAIILSASVGRKPVQQFYGKVLSLASDGKFDRELAKTDYDDLYHLFLELNTSKGRIGIEKNEVITTFTNNKYNGEETFPVSNIPQGLTFGELLTNGKLYMGENKFFSYSAKDNNCQDFIIGLLKGSKMGDSNVYNFVKQTTTQLFTTTTRKLANTLTDIAGRANVLFYGVGVKRKLIKRNQRGLIKLK